MKSMMARPLLAALLLLAPLLAAAESINHQVVPGDTLISIATRYLGGPNYWVELQKANPGIRNPRRLVPGSLVVVPAPPGGQGAVALHVTGKVQLIRLGAARDLTRDTELLETDIVDVPAGGYVTLRWPEGIITHLLPGARLRVTRTAAQAAAGFPPRLLELQGGTVENQVPKEPGRNFQIRTRYGAAAVRGTQFGVRLAAQGAMVTEVTEGTVELAGEGWQPVTLPAGTGAVADASKRQPQAVPMLPAMALDEPIYLTPGTPLAAPPVPGAASYEVELGAAGAPPQPGGRSTVAAPPFALAKLPDGNYQLTVRAVDGQGIPGLRTQRTLTLITLVPPFHSEPANDALVAAGLPSRLLCTEVPNATQYEIAVWRVDAPQEVRRFTSRDACAAQLPGLPAGGYQWQATSLRDLPQGRVLRSVPSQPGRFTVVNRPPAPTVREGTVPNGIRLAWEGEAGERYVVQAATDLAFTTLVSEQKLDAPQVVLSVPTGLTWYVRIQTIAANGFASDFSAPRILRGPPWLGAGDGAVVRDSSGAAIGPPPGNR